MANLIKLPKGKYGDGGYINPVHIVRITEDYYRRPHDKTREPEPITAIVMVDGYKVEFNGHIQDELATLLMGDS